MTSKISVSGSDSQGPDVSALDCVPDGLALFDNQGRLYFANSQLLSALALEDSCALKGLNFDDFIKAGRLEPLDTRDASETAPYLAHDRHDSRSLRLDALQSKAPSGRIYEICRVPFQVPGYMDWQLARWSDITASAQASSVAHECLAATGDAVAIWDEAQQLITANAAFCDLMAPIGDFRTEAPSYTDFIARLSECRTFELSQDAEAWLKEKLERQSNPASNELITHRDGRLFQLHERRGDSGSTVFVLTDISTTSAREQDAIRADNTIRRATGSLSRARSRLRDYEGKLNELETDLSGIRAHAARSDAAVSTFVRGLSNDLRAPLNSMIGFAQVMGDELYGPLGDERYREYSALIQESALALLDLVSRVLEISKIQAGRHDLDVVTEDIEPILECALSFVRQKADKQNIKVTLKTSPNLPRVPVDSSAMQTAIQALLTNAIDFTPSGGEVTIAVEPTRDMLLIKISDTGIGISPSDLARVLKPFERGTNAGVRDTRKAGLGLPLVKALMDLHGGRFALESHVGEGTTATLSLPTNWSAVSESRTQGENRAAS